MEGLVVGAELFPAGFSPPSSWLMSPIFTLPSEKRTCTSMHTCMHAYVHDWVI